MSGMEKVVSNVPLRVNKYASLAPSAPMNTRSLPIAATAPPKTSYPAGVGLVMVVSNGALGFGGEAAADDTPSASARDKEAEIELEFIWLQR